MTFDLYPDFIQIAKVFKSGISVAFLIPHLVLYLQQNSS